MFIACLWSHWTDPKEPDVRGFATITDEPPADVAAVGHDRCIINLMPEHVEAWLTPEGRERGGAPAIPVAIFSNLRPAVLFVILLLHGSLIVFLLRAKPAYKARPASAPLSTIFFINPAPRLTLPPPTETAVIPHGSGNDRGHRGRSDSSISMLRTTYQRGAGVSNRSFRGDVPVLFCRPIVS